jgi:general secretion pathway protein E
VVQDKTLDLRLSFVPAVTGPQLVMRIWDASRMTLDMDRIFPRAVDRAGADRILAMPNGLVLVSGPTGSGKTTTAYALLQALAEAGRAVYTVEDPVEVVLGRVAALERVVQVQVGPGFDMATALRRVLQADPDVVFLADVPDGQTARLACQVATSGHLVLVQMHAQDPDDAIAQFARRTGDASLVASCLAVSTSQRLFRRVHRDCEGSGCSDCVDGYRGRTVGYDFQFSDRTQRAALSKGVFKERGDSGLRNAGTALVASGETTREEVSRVLD